MRHLSFFALLALAGTLALAGCDKGDSDSLDHPEHFNNEGFSPFDSTYTVNADGLCTLKNAYKYSDAEIKKYVIGCVWGISSYSEVLPNGKVNGLSYMMLKNATDYWFETDKQMVALYRENGLHTYSQYGRVEYTYDSSTGILWRKYNDPLLDKTDSYMQILRLYAAGNKTYMLTLQKIGNQTDDDGKQQPTFAIVMYERIANGFKSGMKSLKDQGIDFDGVEAVPDYYKFGAKWNYQPHDYYHKNICGADIEVFKEVGFTLTDISDKMAENNMAMQYFDSIVWRSDMAQLPDKYCVYKKGESTPKRPMQWTSYFLYKESWLTTQLDGYKNGRVVYTYNMRFSTGVAQSLRDGWQELSNKKPFEYTVSNPLNRQRSFTVYSPRLTSDTSLPYAQLRYNTESKGSDKATLQKEADELTALINNHYSEGTDVSGNAETCQQWFHALPKKADIKTYWGTSNARFALVLGKDATGSYYYIQAEPR